MRPLNARDRTAEYPHIRREMHSRKRKRQDGPGGQRTKRNARRWCLVSSVPFCHRLVYCRLPLPSLRRSPLLHRCFPKVFSLPSPILLFPIFPIFPIFLMESFDKVGSSAHGTAPGAEFAPSMKKPSSQLSFGQVSFGQLVNYYRSLSVEV